jgi:hypothetical protein
MTQYLSTIVTQANAIAAVSGQRLTVATLSIAAGEWIVDGELWCAVTGGTPTLNYLGAFMSEGALVGPVTDPADNQSLNILDLEMSRSSSAAIGWVLPLASLYIKPAATTTISLAGNASWAGGGTLSLYGMIAASGTPATGIISSGPFVYVHLTDGSWEGYINLAMAQFVRSNGGTGSILQIESRVIDVTEAPDAIVGAV